MKLIFKLKILQQIILVQIRLSTKMQCIFEVLESTKINRFLAPENLGFSWNLRFSTCWSKAYSQNKNPNCV